MIINSGIAADLILAFTSRKEFRQWLIENHDGAKECWVTVKRGRPTPYEHLFYLDAVEEALCFGWIDSTARTHDGCSLQRFSPRKKNSPWSELNIARCRRLEKLGLMTESGRRALPEMAGNSDFVIDPDILNAFMANPAAWEKFQNFPELYRRIRIDTIQRDKKKDVELFWKRVERLIQKSEQGEMFGDWNDYGRLLD